jgi:hypothetical protein
MSAERVMHRTIMETLTLARLAIGELSYARSFSQFSYYDTPRAQQIYNVPRSDFKCNGLPR